MSAIFSKAAAPDFKVSPASVIAAPRHKFTVATYGLVFRSPVTGGCYYAGVIQQHTLKHAFERIGVSGGGLGWHTFRHTYRSLLDETGAPIGVQQKLMRHSNVATTMNVYGNASLKAKQQANSKAVQMVIAQQLPDAEPQAKAG
ncbi:MAG TPA: tyrosine-type recombinase/integrase [Terracidiphilus sp.]|nr:tyrosine-type recombinase/integrase [Terracidiphilus sp.]